jgi:hypothetical protein
LIEGDEAAIVLVLLVAGREVDPGAGSRPGGRR